MSNKNGKISPVKFNAGGSSSSSNKRSRRSPQKNKKNEDDDDNDAVQSTKTLQNEAVVSGSGGPATIQMKEVQTTLGNLEKNQATNTNNNNNNNNFANSKSNAMVEWIQSGLHKKQSPLLIKNWIATVLTLDGRDKFTKVLQYSSRLLGWYFAGLAATRSIPTTSGMVQQQQQQQQQQLYQALSTRFTSLYKSLVTSRKAFRMGRSVIEWDKIQSMGWGHYLGYLLRHPLAEGGGDDDDDDYDELEKEDCVGVGVDGDGEEASHHHSLGRYDTHPIPEEDEGEEERGDDDNDEDDDDGSWDGEETSATVEEKKDDTTTTTQHQPLSEKNKKVVSRPARPVLPSRVSSNIGWGPSNTTAIDVNASSSSSKSQHQHPPPPRTVSEMGRRMYQPYPSQSSSSFGSYKQLKGTSTSTLTKKTLSSPPTPAWKLIGGTLKLLGLMGFWAFDNLSFLTSSGFLDPITSDGTKSNNATTTTIRTKRKQRASEYAGRCYFVGGLAGLYVNLRSFWIHRNGALAEARRKHHDESATASNDKDDDDNGARRGALKKIEQRHFELFLALLKSICDVTVFSNNPGIDLHLKLRGKKNHEGFHCLCGLISASTVLYNNFPNAE